MIAQAKAVTVMVDSVNCNSISVSINATAEEFSSLPQDLEVTISGQTRVALLNLTDSAPTHGSEIEMMTTVDFNSAFVLPDGSYNMILNLITSETTNYSVASTTINDVGFKGCYIGVSSSGSAAPTETSEVASLSLETATYVNPNSYYSAVGVPTHGISVSPQNDDKSSGLSTGTKIGITVGVLAAALLATLTAMAFVLRRWRQKQSTTTGGSKARRFANGKWINEDRNSAELKEIYQNQA